MHFRLMLASFSHPFLSMCFYINSGAFLGGRRPSGLVGILHFGVWMVIFLCVFQHSGKVAVKHPRDSHLSDLSQVTLQVPLGSCTGDFICGEALDPVPQHAGVGSKATSRRGGSKGLRLCRRPQRLEVRG